MRSHRLIGVSVLCIAARDARAQRIDGAVDGNVDVGAAVLRQPGLAGSSVFTLASQLRYAARRSAFSASGIAARTPEDRFTGQAVATGTVYAPAPQRLRWELAASATAFGLSGATGTLGWQLLAREHLSLSRGGIFSGAGFGQTQREYTWRPTAIGEVGGFLRLDPLEADVLTAGLTVIAADTRAGEFSPSFDPTAPNAVSHADFQAYWSHSRGRIELLAGAGVRYGIRHLPAEDAQWASASAALWVTPRVALSASAGRALADLVRGVPTVRYASLSLRFGFRDRAGAARARAAAAPNDDHHPRVEVRQGAGDLRVITVRASAISTVEMMADFTDWEPVTLIRDPITPSLWTFARPLTAGTHRIAVRIDGGEWMVPPNLPRVADGFGGAVGLLTVP